MSHSQKSYYQAPRKSGVSWITFLIVLVTTVVASFVIYHNIDNIKELFGDAETSSETTGPLVGDSIQLVGILARSTDPRSFSHTLESAEYGTVGIKSRTLNLNAYTGELQLSGYIEKLQGTMFIVEIDAIVGQEIELLPMDTQGSASGKYISQAGLYFPQEFFAQYQLVNSGQGGVLQILDTNSQKTLSISYFACVAGDVSKDCKQLAQNFAGAGEKTLETSHGVQLFKLSEVDSWFARSEYRGYFFNDIPEAEVLHLAQYLRFVNSQMVEERIVPNLSKLCRNEITKLENLNTHELSKAGDMIVVSVSGFSPTHNITCELSLDPTLEWGASLLDFKTSDLPTVQTGTTETTNTTSGDIISDEKPAFEDYDGAQFPLNLEKALTFESRRGFKIVFPAGNISFASSNISENLGEAGVHCFSQMNVVKYGTSEEDRDTNPSVKIYECTIKNGFVGDNTYRHLELADDKHFLIKAMDPAWQDFRDNVAVEIIESVE